MTHPTCSSMGDKDADDWSRLAARYANERDDWKARADKAEASEQKSRDRITKVEAALRMAIAIIEKDHIPPAPTHSCRPDDQCDQSCADYFYAWQDLEELRNALSGDE